jgi:hypothetical protein
MVANRTVRVEACGMPVSLSDQVRECLRHAEDCARQAASQSDPGLRRDFLDVEASWLKLARGYELTERLADFSKSTRTDLLLWQSHYQRQK